jgi:hypothetical protein
MALLARQNEQLGVGREHLSHGVLKLTSGAHPRGDVLGPFFGDAFDAVFACRHEGQGPSDVAGIFRGGAMAGGSATAGMGLGERPRQQVARYGEAVQELELALP